jgi:integrase
VLELPELRAIWQATDTSDLYGGIVRLLLLTGQRRLEIAEMRWSEIVEDYALETDRNGQPTETCTALVLPPERTKNKRKHAVPLPAPAREIIEARRAEQTVMGIASPFVFATSGRPQNPDAREHGGKPFAQWNRSKVALDARLQLAPWTIHDLRRAFVTHCADKLRIAPHVVEAIVNHISGTKGGVAGIYNRAEYLPERRRALDAWADYVLEGVGTADLPEGTRQV